MMKKIISKTWGKKNKNVKKKKLWLGMSKENTILEKKAMKHWLQT